MFTGLIDHCGTIQTLDKSTDCLTIKILGRWQDVEIGESIAVDGTCLTVTEVHGSEFICQVSPETRRVSIAQFYDIGQLVNLERALQMGQRFGGHMVLGHVDTYAYLSERQMHGDYLEYLITGLPEEKQIFLVKKGSIAINGVSLTVNHCDGKVLSVMLIPQTLAQTNLAELEIGQTVNIEYDYFAKIICRQMEAWRSTMEIG